MKSLSLILSIFVLIGSGFAETEFPVGKWVSIFNGKDLSGWVPKFTGSKLGENYKDTFRVVDGVIRVDYSQYEKWDNNFGHLFYNKKLSNYRIRLEYRFFDKQLPNGPGWAVQNSGIMLHCQEPKTMDLDQDFPISLEFQLLGLSQELRTTGNVCTPGTYITINGAVDKTHCINSKELARPLGEWVVAEAEVRGNQIIKHFINGKEVLSYTDLRLDSGDEVDSGWISLQSESHPCEFRKIEIQLLEE